VEVLSKHAGLWITRNKEIMYSQVRQLTLCFFNNNMIAINVFLKKKKRAHMNIGVKVNLSDLKSFVTNFEPLQLRSHKIDNRHKKLRIL
jgi:hypothetical protein